MNPLRFLRKKLSSRPSHEGHLDYCDGDSVVGWARDPRRPASPVDVELFLDGVPIARTTANIFREDLRQAGIGDGFHGFVVVLPLFEVCERVRQITARPVGSEQCLAGGPIAVVPRNRLTREALARMYISGQGIEIGALHTPLPVPPGVTVRFVDRLSREDLYAHYPEIQGQNIVDVDVVDEGETLGSFPDASQDFVIANHFLEHCQDPLGTLANLVRVLRPQGVVFLTLPDHRISFDKDRPITSIEHIARDHREGPEWSCRDHYREWVKFVGLFPEDKIEAHAQELMAGKQSIHFHCWEINDLLAVAHHCASDMRLPIMVECLTFTGVGEMALILRKTA